jgi:hypothetical protein
MLLCAFSFPNSMQDPTTEMAPRDPKRVYIDHNPDGSVTFSQNGAVVAQPLHPAVQAKIEKAERSANQARLDALEGGAPALLEVESAADPSAPWYVGGLDLEGITRVGVWAGRNKHGVLALHEKGKFTSLLAAMLFVAVRNPDGTDYFPDFDDAYDQAARKTAKAVELNSDLFASIIALNPGVLPEAHPDDTEKKTTLSPTMATGNADGNQKTASSLSRAERRRRRSKKTRSTAAPL